MISILASIFIFIIILWTLRSDPPLPVILVQAACLLVNAYYAIIYLQGGAQ